MNIGVSILKQIIVQVVQEMTAEDSAATPSAAEPAAAASTPDGTMTMTVTAAGGLTLAGTGPAECGFDPERVVVAVSPAFSTLIHETIIDLPRTTVLKEIAAGIEEGGLRHRLMKIYKTADVDFITHQAAKLSGSDTDIGIQSRGTTVIHQKDLPPLNSVKLFSQSPLIDLEAFRTIGKSAAKYAEGESPQPVPICNDQMVHPKYQTIAVLLHNKEAAQCDLAKKP